MKRTGSKLLPGLVGCWIATPVLAQSAPSGPLTITGGATLITDYRFRGISQTDMNVAAQATATIQHRSGFYASFWSSSIDNYVANGSDAEIDLIAGYRRTVSGTTVDGGFLYYVYPGNGGAKTNFAEPYVNVSHSYGTVTAKLGANLAWKQSSLALTPGEKRGGVYVYGELSTAIPKTSVTVTGHLGHSFARNYITFGDRYTDWSIAATYTIRQISLGVSYVDTDIDEYSYPAGGGRNRDVTRGGVLASIGLTF